MTADKQAVYVRARILCRCDEPHAGRIETPADEPCQRHSDEAIYQFDAGPAIALVPSLGRVPGNPAEGGASGAAVVMTDNGESRQALADSHRPAAPTSTSNRATAANGGPAERGTAWPRIEGTAR